MADIDGTNTVIDGAEVFDGGIIAQEKRAERQYIHAGTSANQRPFPFMVHERVDKPFYPKSWTRLIFGHQQPKRELFELRVGFNSVD
jgi:hypothetical protein